MSHIGILSGEEIPETIPCIEQGRVILKTVNNEMRGIIDRAKAGVFKILAGSNIGIDLRGKTKERVDSYYISGMVHYLDGATFRIIELLLGKKEKITLFLKNCLERNNWKGFAYEFNNKLGASIMLEILRIKKRVFHIVHPDMEANEAKQQSNTTR